MFTGNEWLDVAEISVCRRIDRVIKEYGITAESFSEIANIPIIEARKMLNGKKKYSIPTISAICLYYDINANWLFSEQGKMYKEPDMVDTDGLCIEIDEYAFISHYTFPIFKDGQESFYRTDKGGSPIPFRRDWLDKNISTSINNLSVFEVLGDSMEGVLNHGDSILINHAETEPRDGLYVLRIGNDLFVKRVQRIPGKLLVTSENPRYAPFEIDLSHTDDDIAIIGRVEWYGRSID
ncbi:S24 family peptidase [Neisseria sp. N95_16]|nr:S24 family peptidase [Neisseria sp. N95_16]